MSGNYVAIKSTGFYLPEIEMKNEALHARFAGGCFALPAGPATLDACMRDAAALLADRAEAMTRLFVAAGSARC